MKKMNYMLSCFLFCFTSFGGLIAQDHGEVVIIEKHIDENGDVKETEIIKEFKDLQDQLMELNEKFEMFDDIENFESFPNFEQHQDLFALYNLPKYDLNIHPDDFPENLTLRDEGEHKPFLGVQLGKNSSAIFVTRVLPNSSADESGIMQGDILLKLNGEMVNSREDFVRDIRSFNVGDVVELQIERDGKKQIINVKLGQHERLRTERYRFHFPESFRAYPGQENSFGHGDIYEFDELFFNKYKLGISVYETGDGLNVESVEGDSEAERLGISEGDILTKIDGKNIKSAEQLMKTLNQDEEATHELEALRDGNLKNFIIEKHKPKVLKRL